jgi:hypothetical protein
MLSILFCFVVDQFSKHLLPGTSPVLIHHVICTDHRGKVKGKKKGKAAPLQAWSGGGGSRKLN